MGRGRPGMGRTRWRQESLIRRSPASAPLLDAVKDRKTRDAVRSVIERLTGGGPKPAADAAAPANAPAADAKAN